MAFNAYCWGGFTAQIYGDLQLRNRQGDRRLLFVTHRGRPGVEWKTFRKGIEDSLLHWLHRRMGIRSCLGVYRLDEKSAIRWHAIVDSERGLPRASDVWMQKRPPTWRRWSTGYGCRLT